ncbi:putative uncharacterized protein [Rhodococcus sp. AW25M09]|uniref:hypothetical protein n=1 Tax=Rhodococcus sp. AW25M09 TaxID=1268303 RepID=UPI0002ACD789|nr:hypothetical protein [Rhodococcus sp. AW25M09]CCQ16889.1 putative uncharacterized protein [Rhodococcus sp. AW25M09]
MSGTAREENFSVPVGTEWPGPDTIVLLHRELVPGVDMEVLSRFAHDRWYLNSAVFEENAQSASLNFAAIPAPLRLMAKHYYWQQINTDSPAGMRSAPPVQTSIASLLTTYPQFKSFILWLDNCGITALNQVDAAVLDNYLIHLLDSETMTLGLKYRRAAEVRRLWSYRALLPEQMRLPAVPPWGGDPTRELFGRSKAERENLTHRISEATMQPLLSWALRFVEDFSEDIINAHTEFRFLHDRSRKRRRALGTLERSPNGQIEQRMALWLEHLRASELPLPGKRQPDGSLAVHWPHVGKVLNCTENRTMANTPAGKMALDSGIRVTDGCFLEVPITGTVGGQRWRNGPIEFDEARRLGRLLSTACFVVLSYLSGARPGEVLNLRRGCVSYDSVTDLHLLSGVYFKNAVDANGNKIPAGELRPDPWVVVGTVADAVGVLERLHGHELLFPIQILVHHRQQNLQRKGRARVSSVISRDMADFVAWCNSMAGHLGVDPIPADPNGPLNASRFRRTLAWYIRRRPRGLVAGAIQYGHVHTRLIQGYAGDYDSGFSDDYAFEDFLARMEELAEDEKALANGEKLSGPAAGTYRDRVIAAHRNYAGHVLKSDREARELMANPLLKIFHGHGMTCVFDPQQAACQLRGTRDDPLVTPDVDDCRPRCPNIARTDRDIDVVRARHAELSEITGDVLAPPIRHQRDRHEMDRLESILSAHADAGVVQ